MLCDTYIRANKASMLRFLAELVRMDTVNPPGNNYDQMTQLLCRALEEVGMQARRLAVPAKECKRVLVPEQHAFPRWNVIGKWRVPGVKKTIHFNAHYDVVPVSGEWMHGSPFSGRVQRGALYGRGAADMKGSIASLMLALRALKATGQLPTMNVEVSFTADEETDSALGAEWVVKHAPIQPDYAVVMEGGEGTEICCGHNGVVWLEVSVHGKAAHGSRPERGVNALEKMASLVLALSEHKKALAARVFVAPNAKKLSPTLNIGGVFGQGVGGKINTVPALATFSIDRRVLPRESVVAAERELVDAINSAAAIVDCRVSIKKVSENHSCYSEPVGSFFDVMRQQVSAVHRKPAEFTVSSGFNDMHFFAQVLRIPTLGYGPGGENCHAVNEYVPVRSLTACARIYARLLCNFSGV